MPLYTHGEFQRAIFHNLSFRPSREGICTKWDNPAQPELGSVLVYERPESYILSAADYTVPRTFSIPFEGTQHLLRFGCFYEGKTSFRMEGVPSRSSSPTAFLVWEEHARGYQIWNAGKHFRGIEFALFPAYLDKLMEIDPRVADFSLLPANLSCPSLPPSVVSAMWQLSDMTASFSLEPLVLEGILLQCMGTLTDALFEGQFSISDHAPTVYLGRRKLTFSSYDLMAIRQGKEILTENLSDPPSIRQLSKQVFLNEQKLQAGFSLCYHMTIGQYIRTCRMAEAARLLTATDLPVRQISEAVGYKSCASFIQAFRQIYKASPLSFRNRDQKKSPAEEIS